MSRKIEKPDEIRALTGLNQASRPRPELCHTTISESRYQRVSTKRIETKSVTISMTAR